MFKKCCVCFLVLLFSCSSVYSKSNVGEGASLLVFSKTKGYRHKSIPAGKQLIQDIANTHGFKVHFSEDARIFNPKDLNGFDAVLFLNTTGDILNEAQQKAFELYI